MSSFITLPMAVAKVEEFYRAFRVDYGMSKERIALRHKLQSEELSETLLSAHVVLNYRASGVALSEIPDNFILGTLDGIADFIYITAGTVIEIGEPVSNARMPSITSVRKTYSHKRARGLGIMKNPDDEMNRLLKYAIYGDRHSVSSWAKNVFCQIIALGQSCGITLSHIATAFDRVHTANMNKLENGQPILRADGKILKPAGWNPPQLQDIVNNIKGGEQTNNNEAKVC